MSLLNLFCSVDFSELGISTFISIKNFKTKIFKYQVAIICGRNVLVFCYNLVDRYILSTFNYSNITIISDGYLIYFKSIPLINNNYHLI